MEIVRTKGFQEVKAGSNLPEPAPTRRRNSVISFLTARSLLALSNLLGIIRSQSEEEVGNRLELNPNFREELEGAGS